MHDCLLLVDKVATKKTVNDLLDLKYNVVEYVSKECQEWLFDDHKIEIL